MIRRIFGEITEAITTGFLASAISRAWDHLKGQSGERAREVIWENAEKIMGKKGLDDVRGFGHTMAEAQISKADKVRILNALASLEAQVPDYASNFRRIVAKNRGRPCIKTVHNDGRVTYDPDPNWHHPGKEIIEDLANYKKPEELEIAMFAYGILEEAPDGPLDQIMVWLKKDFLPQFEIKFESIAHKVGDGLYSAINLANSIEDERKWRAKERTRLRDSNKLNWLNPKLLWQSFKDLT